MDFILFLLYRDNWRYLNIGKVKDFFQESYLLKIFKRLTWQWWPCVQDSKKDTDVYSRLLDSGERESVGWFGRMALKHVYYHVIIESPVYVRCRIQHAWGWCTGMTQGDVMGRQVGGGFMFGNACTPVVDSCQCMAKPIQYCKVK